MLTITTTDPVVMFRQPVGWHALCELPHGDGGRWLAQSQLIIASGRGVTMVRACPDCADLPADVLLAQSVRVGDRPESLACDESCACRTEQ